MILFPLLLTLNSPYTSLQFCSELKCELQSAVYSEVLEQVEADDIHLRCVDTYSSGR